MALTAVLGSGIVGKAAAWDLRRRGHEVVVADASPDTAEAAAETAPGAVPRVLDATDGSAVTALLAEVDLVVSGLPYRFGPHVAEAAVETGTHYLDFGGNPTIVRSQLKLDDRARSAGAAIVPDCGLAPGMTNVLAVGVIEELGGSGLDELRLRVGALPLRPAGTLGYQLAFNPAGLINEYAEPCEVLTGGVYDTVEPLTGVEQIEWEGIGSLEAFHTAGGSSTLPRRYAGDIAELDYKTLRYPGHAGPFRAMLELGLFEESEQPGTGIAPRTVLLEALGANLPTGADDLVLVRVWGRRGDEFRGFQVVDRNDDRFSALARTTALPTTALADGILRGEVEPGARAMDGAIAAEDLIRNLEPVGIQVEPLLPGQ